MAVLCDGASVPASGPMLKYLSGQALSWIRGGHMGHGGSQPPLAGNPRRAPGPRGGPRLAADEAAGPWTSTAGEG